MKKTLLLLLLYVACTSMYAQTRLKMNTSISMLSNQIHSTSYSGFLNSYNQVYAGILKNPFDTNLAKPFGCILEWSYWIGKKPSFYSDISWSSSSSSNKATFLNGDVRNMAFHINDITTNVGISFGSKKFNLALFVGMLSRKSRFTSSFVYHNGYTSYSPEKDLNGIWTSYRVVGDAGIAANYTFTKNVQAHIRADFMIKQGITKANYSDLFYGKPTFAPTEIGITDDTKGFRIAFGLAYLIWQNK